MCSGSGIKGFNLLEFQINTRMLSLTLIKQLIVTGCGHYLELRQRKISVFLKLTQARCLTFQVDFVTSKLVAVSFFYEEHCNLEQCNKIKSQFSLLAILSVGVERLLSVFTGHLISHLQDNEDEFNFM